MVNATGWLTDAQVAQVCPDERLRGACRGGNCTAIVSPEGKHLADPLGPGEGILIADMDLALVTKRKRMMDSVGHYARPELLSLFTTTVRPRSCTSQSVPRPFPGATTMSTSPLPTSLPSFPPAVAGLVGMPTSA